MLSAHSKSHNIYKKIHGTKDNNKMKPGALQPPKTITCSQLRLLFLNNAKKCRKWMKSDKVIKPLGVVQMYLWDNNA